MRNLTSILSAVALTFALGCGGGDDDDGGNTSVDASTSANIDAGPSGPDAMPANPPIASGLGQICDMQTACVAPETNACLAFSMTATQGLCTPLCAANLPMGTNPMAADSQSCVDNYTGTVGSPLCITGVAQAVGTNVDWHCGIGCGSIGDPPTDLGTCPGGLTCTNNRCQP